MPSKKYNIDKPIIVHANSEHRHDTILKRMTTRLKEIENKTDAEHAQRFFKIGPGQYGEGDLFLGIRVPVLRKLAKERIETPLGDVVDVTAEHIAGAHLFERNHLPLYKLAKSKSLWERRIAIIATFHFIRRNQFTDTLAIAEILLNDPEDLMHKAVGWMLREVGKRDLQVEETFLLLHCQKMPRTMLRYAIEKFPEPKRLAYLRG